MDEQIAAPVGFNITFTGMLSLAIDMGLEFPIRQTDVSGILRFREMELKRFVNDLCLHGNWCLNFWVKLFCKVSTDGFMT